MNIEARDSKPSLTLVRHFKAPPAKVYAAWTDPATLMRWWGPDAGPTTSAVADVVPGGRYKIVFQTENGDEHTCHGEYLEVKEAEKLVFTWEWITMPERRSQVALHFKPRDGGTEFTLVHSQFFDEAARDRHRGGWSSMLDKLQSFLEP